MIKNRKRFGFINNLLTYVVLTIAAAVLVFPFIWMLSGAFKDTLEAVKMPPALLPSKLSFENFIEIEKYFPIDRFLLNSIIVSVVSTVFQLLFCLMAAFIFAKIEFKFKNTLFLLFLVTLMIPEQVIMAPLFIIFSKLGLTDSYLGLILPGLFSAFGTFLLRQHIMTIPDTLIEAAVIDGASYYRIFWKIIFPLSKTALAALSIFAFMNAWNSFLWPLIIISDKNLMTLPLGLSKLTGRWSTEWNILMAGNVISFLPMFIVYLFAQKHFIKGIALTGIKG